MAPKTKKSKSKKNDVGASGSQTRKLDPTTYTSEEIKTMTNGFSDKIGEGAYSKVYRGKLDQEDIAVKVYSNGSQKNRAQPENEIQALKDIGCYPHIVQVRGICVDRPRCLVMKYVPNDLKTLMEESELKWPETVQILVQLASAIKSIIKEDYVVADIKPDGVLIDEEYNVHLCDFGSAKKGGRDLPTVNWHYAAKEAHQIGTGTPKMDIYSFGVILLQMIMRCNDFEPVSSQKSMKTEEKIYYASLEKKNKKKVTIPHISVYARVCMPKDGHIVHKTLIQSGCEDKDAKTITELGIKCTNDNKESRPTIEEIISTLEQLKVKKTKS